jgi:hypothetical protein
MMDLARMLAEHDRKQPDSPPTPPDVLAHTLLEIFARYAAGNPFKPGDLVTPRKNYNIRGAGQPHVVVEILDGAALAEREAGSIAHRADMRLVCEERGEIAPFLGESWCFERYAGPVANVGGGA